jgi:hypothetical protein
MEKIMALKMQCRVAWQQMKCSWVEMVILLILIITEVNCWVLFVVL